MKKLFGFTLSEVLIAMAILGIVSALTIPHIAGNTTKKQYITAFKTTMNSLQSGIKTFKADNGYDFSGNRTQHNGYAILRSVLEQKLGGKAITLRTNQQWLVQGILANDFEKLRDYVDSSTGETVTVKTEILFAGSHPAAGNFSEANAVQSLAFGASGTATEYASPDEASVDDSVTTTIKLPNGAYIFSIMSDGYGCNFNNVRWNGSSYDTPDITQNSNANAKINLCLAYIDVNGPKGPNRITNCMSNSFLISPASTTNCTNMTAKEVADVFPIYYYDDQFYPATSAAYTVLNDLLTE